MYYTPGRNLYVRKTSSDGYITSAGSVSPPDAANQVSDWIEVVPGQVYTFHLLTDSANVQPWSRCALYDENRTFISVFGYSSGSFDYTATVTPPSNARYARLSARHMKTGLARMKFEYGPTATPWRPAPEDDDYFSGGEWERIVLSLDSLSLSAVRDLTSCTRYYLLQSSTLSPPAKPTAKPPGGSWVTAEPGYTAGSTNSLYFCDLNIFSDGDYAYSDVSLSSSYEAAKAAYNLAAAAQATANEALSNTEVIVGTQTAATGAWTGVASFSSLRDGQQIAYWLPYAGSGNATLNLTLSNGTTTGAINCYYGGTSRLTTHYAAGNVIHLTYRQNVSIAGSSTLYTGWWADANYDTNNYDRIRLNNAITAKTAVWAGRIIVGDSGGYFQLAPSVPFDINKPILYAASSFSAGATGTNNYISYPTVTLRNNVSDYTGTVQKTVYIVGTLSGTQFTPSADLFTETEPTADNGVTYIALGLMVSAYQIYLYPEHPMYRYSGGAFLSMNQIACNAKLGVDDIADGTIAVKRLQNSKVTISEDAVTITTEQFSVDIGVDEVQTLRVDSDGVFARRISGEDVEGLAAARRYIGTDDLTVASVAGIGEAVNDRQIDRDITIRLPQASSESLSDGLILHGITGSGKLTVTHSSADSAVRIRLLGGVDIRDCDARIEFVGIPAAYTVTRSPRVTFTNCSGVDGASTVTETVTLKARTTSDYKTVRATWSSSRSEFFVGNDSEGYTHYSGIWFDLSSIPLGALLSNISIRFRRSTESTLGGTRYLHGYTAQYTSPSGGFSTSNCTSTGANGSSSSSGSWISMAETPATVEKLRSGCYVLIGTTASNNFVKMYGSGSTTPPELTLTYTYEAPNQAFSETVSDTLLQAYLPKIGFGKTGYNAYCKYITFGSVRIAYGKAETYTTARHYPDAFSGLFAGAPYIIGSWSSTATSLTSGNFGTLKFFKVTADGFSVAAAGSSAPTSNQPFDWIAIGEAAT